LEDVASMAWPTIEHKDAFADLYKNYLREDLQKRPFPPVSCCITPGRYHWPEYAETMIELYQKWWHRIHLAANLEGSKYRTEWKKVVAYFVAPIQDKQNCCKTTTVVAIVGSWWKHCHASVQLWDDWAAKWFQVATVSPGHPFRHWTMVRGKC